LRVIRATLLSQPFDGSELDHAIEPVDHTAPSLRVVKYTMSARTSGFCVPISPWWLNRMSSWTPG